MSNHRNFKDGLYLQFARIGQALSSAKRMELLDLLAQGEKTVELLAQQCATPVKNTSAHLRVLRQASLVERRGEGTYVYYRLADDDVLRVLRGIQALGQRRYADVQRIVELYMNQRDELDPVTSKELQRLMKGGSVVVVDVRPAEEFRAGHIPGALSIPVQDLKRRMREIPKRREVIAYCRGPYCIYSLDAVTMLRQNGYKARRAADGLPDWRVTGFPVELGA